MARKCHVSRNSIWLESPQVQRDHRVFYSSKISGKHKRIIKRIAFRAARPNSTVVLLHKYNSSILIQRLILIKVSHMYANRSKNAAARAMKSHLWNQFALACLLAAVTKRATRKRATDVELSGISTITMPPCTCYFSPAFSLEQITQQFPVDEICYAHEYQWP